jgi:hypothetical protein
MSLSDISLMHQKSPSIWYQDDFSQKSTDELNVYIDYFRLAPAYKKILWFLNPFDRNYNNAQIARSVLSERQIEDSLLIPKLFLN